MTDDDDEPATPLVAYGLLAALFAANAACLLSLTAALSRPEGFGPAVFWGMGIAGINFYWQQHTLRRLRSPAGLRALFPAGGLTALAMLFAAFA